jgi:hypothetical protein
LEIEGRYKQTAKKQWGILFAQERSFLPQLKIKYLLLCKIEDLLKDRDTKGIYL